MIQTRQNEQIIKISNWISPKFDKYESILAFIFLIILLLHIGSTLNVGVFMILTLSTLAIFYFLKAYSISVDTNAGGTERFIDKLASMSLSVSVMGILFRLENWPGYGNMLIIGSITLVIIFSIILFLQSKKPDLQIFTKRLKFRILIIAVIGLLLYFTPVDELIKIGILKNNNIELTK